MNKFVFQYAVNKRPFGNGILLAQFSFEKSSLTHCTTVTKMPFSDAPKGSHEADSTAENRNYLDLEGSSPPEVETCNPEHCNKNDNYTDLAPDCPNSSLVVRYFHDAQNTSEDYYSDVDIELTSSETMRCASEPDCRSDNDLSSSESDRGRTRTRRVFLVPQYSYTIEQYSDTTQEGIVPAQHAHQGSFPVVYRQPIPPQFDLEIKDVTDDPAYANVDCDPWYSQPNYSPYDPHNDDYPSDSLIDEDFGPLHPVHRNSSPTRQYWFGYRDGRLEYLTLGPTEVMLFSNVLNVERFDRYVEVTALDRGRRLSVFHDPAAPVSYEFVYEEDDEEAQENVADRVYQEIAAMLRELIARRSWREVFWRWYESEDEEREFGHRYYGYVWIFDGDCWYVLFSRLEYLVGRSWYAWWRDGAVRGGINLAARGLGPGFACGLGAVVEMRLQVCSTIFLVYISEEISCSKS